MLKKPKIGNIITSFATPDTIDYMLCFPHKIRFYKASQLFYTQARLQRIMNSELSEVRRKTKAL